MLRSALRGSGALQCFFIDARCTGSKTKRKKQKKRKGQKQKKKKERRWKGKRRNQTATAKGGCFRCDRYSTSPSSSLELFFLSLHLSLFPLDLRVFVTFFEPTEWPLFSLSFQPRRESFLRPFPCSSTPSLSSPAASQWKSQCHGPCNFLVWAVARTAETGGVSNVLFEQPRFN